MVVDPPAPDQGDEEPVTQGSASTRPYEGTHTLEGAEAHVSTSRRIASTLKARRQSLAAQGEGMRRKVEEARPRSAVIDSALRAVEHDNLTGGPVLAGAIAFRLFLVLIPYVFVIVMLLGLSVSDETSSRDLASEIGIAGLVAAAVDGTTELSLWQRLVALVLGLVALLWATRTAIKVLRVAHSLIWAERPSKGPLVKPVVFSLATLTLFVLGAFVIRKIEDLNLLLGIAAMLASVMLPAGVWLLASMHLPHADAPWWALVPGAVIFGVGVEVLHLVTVYWIAREIESKSDLYGAIGTALALLFWAYLLGRIITFGAVVNATLWRRHQALEKPAAAH